MKTTINKPTKVLLSDLSVGNLFVYNEKLFYKQAQGIYNQLSFKADTYNPPDSTKLVSIVRELSVTI